MENDKFKFRDLITIGAVLWAIYFSIVQAWDWVDPEGIFSFMLFVIVFMLTFLVVGGFVVSCLIHVLYKKKE